MQQLGFEVFRQEGSHIRLNRGGIHVTVPIHPQLVPKTLQSILRHAEITLEEFMGQF